jgi:endonuclease/exonuclease/phosphatase family metal-dependent hydrolase
MKLKVLTLNVWNQDGDARRIEVINREIRRLAPDLVSFQEVVAAPGVDQLARLIEGTGLHGSHQSRHQSYTPKFADRFGGSAVASRWPHRVEEVIDLRIAGAADVPWATIAISLQIPHVGELLFIGATTAWRLEAEAVREQQVLAIADLDARHRRALPTIIAGDFNAGPDAASIRFMTGRQSLAGRSVHYLDVWEAAGSGPGCTWRGTNPNTRQSMDLLGMPHTFDRRFDYIFVAAQSAHPQGRCRPVRATTVFDDAVEGLWLSDHSGVLAELEISAAPTT